MNAFLKGLAFLVPAIGVMLTLVFGAALAAAIPRRNRLRRLARSRNSRAAFDEFCMRFPDQPKDLLQAIYNSLQRAVGVDNFPLRADDDLWRTLELDQGSVESEVESFLERYGSRNPTLVPSSALPCTVADLVLKFYLRARSTVG